MQVIVLNLIYYKNIRNSTPKKEKLFAHIYSIIYIYKDKYTHKYMCGGGGGGVYKHSSDEHKQRFFEKLSIYVSL